MRTYQKPIWSISFFKNYSSLRNTRTKLLWWNTRINNSLKLELIDLDTANTMTLKGLKFKKANWKKNCSGTMRLWDRENKFFRAFFVEFRYWNKTNLKRGKQRYTSRETRSNLIPIDRAARGDLPRGRASSICGTLDSRSRLLTSKDSNPQPLHHCSNKNQPSALDWWFL